MKNLTRCMLSVHVKNRFDNRKLIKQIRFNSSNNSFFFKQFRKYQKPICHVRVEFQQFGFDMQNYQSIYRPQLK